MSPQTVSIRTRCTYTYRPLTPSLTPASSTTSSPIERSTTPVIASKISKPSRKPRRSNRNLAWPSKQCQQPAALSAGLESYLMLLEQQRDAVASRCSSVASGAFSRENTPVSLAE